MAEQSWWEEELTKHWGTGETTHETRRAAKTALGEIERLRAAAVGANAGAGWQPIETPPTDGVVLLWARFNDDDKEGDVYLWWDVTTPIGGHLIPTHWMPLPPAPARAAVRADETSDEKSADTPVT